MIVTDYFPRLLLRAEAAIVAIMAVALYFLVDYPGWLLVVLAPDLSMLAGLAVRRLGPIGVRAIPQRQKTYKSIHPLVPSYKDSGCRIGWLV